MESYGVIEVDMFGKEVNDAEHPEAVRFRAVLEDVAADKGCFLIYFEVEEGVVSFAFDNDELMADIVKVLKGGDAGAA